MIPWACDRVRYSADHSYGGIDSKPATPEVLGEILPLQPLHGQEWQSIRAYAVGDVRGDPRMLQLGKTFGFPQKSLLARVP
jgi:hypothetical protein